MAFFKQNFAFHFSLLSFLLCTLRLKACIPLCSTSTPPPPHPLLSTPSFADFLSSFILFTYITNIKSMINMRENMQFYLSESPHLIYSFQIYLFSYKFHGFIFTAE